MPQAKHSPMVIAAARELCKRACVQLAFEFEPWWATYRDDYIADAQAVFDAAGVDDLVRVLRYVDTLEAIAEEIDCFEHSARAASLRIIAKIQRAALTRATGV